MDDYGFDLDYVELKLTQSVGNKEIEANPAYDTVTIELAGINHEDVAIYNMAGQLIYHKTTSDKRIQLFRGSDYKPGMYLVRGLGENRKAYYKKLIFW